MIPRFRAWDEKNKEMFKDTFAVTESGEVVTVEQDFITIAPDYIFVDHLTLMQSTGLTDKNGKEIFEGDIVKVTDGDERTNFPDGGIGTICGLDEIFMWYIDGQVHNGLFDISQEYYIEVIGNIWEDGELLDGENTEKIEFDNECKCLVDYSELEKAILWYQKKPSLSKKKIYLHGHYPAVSIHNEKIHVHRLLMQYWLRTRIPFEYSVHHLNENKLDARKENLSLILNKTHNSKHNKGRIFSESHKRKISMANHNRKGLKMKKRISIPLEELKTFLVEGKSINWIASHYGCDWSTIRNRIYENPELLEVGS